MVRWKSGIRLWPLIDLNSNPPHWMWKGPPSPTSGYGTARDSKQRQTSAHRAVYEMIMGEIPKGLNVCHKCDIRLCVNPKCMFLGTQKDNIADARQKGRLRGGPKSGQSGRKNNNSKYSDEQVSNVLKLFKNGVSQRDIELITGVPYASVWYIVRKQKHDGIK